MSDKIQIAELEELQRHFDLALRKAEGVSEALRRRAEKAEAEIAALRGAAVPVAYLITDEQHNHVGVMAHSPSVNYYRSKGLKVDELFTHPAPPVVAPIYKMKHWRMAPYNGVDWAKGYQAGWNKAVEKALKAGFKIKSADGEEDL